MRRVEDILNRETSRVVRYGGKKRTERKELAMCSRIHKVFGFSWRQDLGRTDRSWPTQKKRKGLPLTDVPIHPHRSQE